MKNPLLAGLLAALLGRCLMHALAMAQSAFDGTWKIDLDKLQMPKKPSVLLLHNGMYQCKTWVPAISIKADRTDQPVSGHPYFDMIAVKIVDAHTIQETDKHGGKVVSVAKMTVVPDGKSMTIAVNDKLHDTTMSFAAMKQ